MTRKFDFFVEIPLPVPPLNVLYPYPETFWTFQYKTYFTVCHGTGKTEFECSFFQTGKTQGIYLQHRKKIEVLKKTKGLSGLRWDISMML